MTDRTVAAGDTLQLRYALRPRGGDERMAFAATSVFWVCSVGKMIFCGSVNSFAPESCVSFSCLKQL